MKKKTDLIWASLLILTAVLFFYLGNKTGSIETGENLTITLQKKDERITALESKLQQLSDELTSRGIYSYPQAHLVSKDGGSSATVLINLNGKEAIRNLEIERKLLPDYSRLADSELKKSGRVTKASIGSLTSHNPVAFTIQEFEKEVAIDLTFKTERDRWHQHIWARRSPNGEIRTFWVITNREYEVIDKHIDQGFPTDEEGKVNIGGDRKLKYSEIKMNSVFRPYSQS